MRIDTILIFSGACTGVGNLNIVFLTVMFCFYIISIPWD